jgi:hypothetical protein
VIPGNRRRIHQEASSPALKINKTRVLHKRDNGIIKKARVGRYRAGRAGGGGRGGTEKARI